MVVFDLSHDRMSAEPLADLLDVQAAFIFHEDRYAEAARKMGLSRTEVAELDRRVIAGKVGLTRLPGRLDAMAGMRHGRVYVLRSVQVKGNEETFVIALADGKRVYVPMRCGNLSLLATAPVRIAPSTPPIRRHGLSTAVSRPAPVPKPPAPETQPTPVAAAIVPPAAAASPALPPSHPATGLFFAAWIVNAIDSVVNGGPSLPPCDVGRTSDAGGCRVQ